MTKTRLFLIYLFAIFEFQMKKNALVRSNLKLERNDLRPTALFKTCYKASIVLPRLINISTRNPKFHPKYFIVFRILLCLELKIV